MIPYEFPLFPKEKTSGVDVAFNFLKLRLTSYYRNNNTLPVGSNAEIIKVLLNKYNKSIDRLGNNYIKNHINRNFELIDDWGTPYQLYLDSYRVLIMISAGKNKRFYDSDDIFAAVEITGETLR
jgi:hypothetical protein